MDALNRNTAVEVRIRDMREDRPNVLVSLAALLARLEALCPEALSGRWQVGQGIYGYGTRVMELEEATSDGPVAVDGARLFPVFLTDREYLDHGTLTKLGGDRLELGVFASTFLFIRCRRDLGEAVAAEFRDAEVVEAT